MNLGGQLRQFRLRREDGRTSGQKEDMSSQRRTYGNPTWTTMRHMDTTTWTLMDYSIWSILESKACATRHDNLEK